MFRRAHTKDLESNATLYMGGGVCDGISDEELERFFEPELRDFIKAATAGDLDQIVKTHVISDGTVDRHGDTIDVDGWDTKDYSGVVLLNHGKIGFSGVRETTLPVARSMKTWKYAGKLKSVTAFTPPSIYEFGHTVGKLVAGGYLPGASVGFMPTKWNVNEERKDAHGYSTYDFLQQKLHEYSVVQVGSNPNALVEEGLQSTILEAFTAAKEQGIDTKTLASEMERILDTETLDEAVRRSVESVFFEHKDAIFHPVTQSPQQHEAFVASIKEIL